MTRAEAYRILGISRSVSRSSTVQAYRETQKKLRVKLIPGNSLVDRQKAQAELARVTTAWQILQTAPARKTRAKKPTRKKPPRVKPATVRPDPKPQTLAEAWELLTQLLPFSEPVIVIISIAVFLLIIVLLLTSF